MFIDKTKFEHIGTLTNTGSTDLEFHFPQRAQVKRIVLIATTAASASGTVTVKKNGTAVGSFPTGAVVDNALIYADVGHVDPDGAIAADGSTIYEGGVTYVQYNAGDYLTLTPANTASTGVYEAYVEYIPEGLNEAEVDTKVVYTAA